MSSSATYHKKNHATNYPVGCNYSIASLTSANASAGSRGVALSFLSYSCAGLLKCPLSGARAPSTRMLALERRKSDDEVLPSCHLPILTGGAGHLPARKCGANVVHLVPKSAIRLRFRPLTPPRPGLSLERTTGFEPATLTLARRQGTTADQGKRTVSDGFRVGFA